MNGPDKAQQRDEGRQKVVKLIYINDIFLIDCFLFLGLVVNWSDHTQQRNEGTQKVVKLI